MLHKGFIKHHAGFGQLVDVRAFDLFDAIGAQLRAQVINGDKQHVGALGSMRERGQRQHKGCSKSSTKSHGRFAFYKSIYSDAPGFSRGAHAGGFIWALQAFHSVRNCSSF